MSAYALSTVTSIPLVRLLGNKQLFGQYEKAVHMSAEYKDYAHASLDIINTFHWKKVALVCDGNYKVLIEDHNICIEEKIY